MLGTHAADPQGVTAEFGDEVAVAGGTRRPLTITRSDGGAGVPGALYAPTQAGGRAALVIHRAGAQGLEDAFGNPGALLAGLLQAGYTVLQADPLGIGGSRHVSPRHDDDWFWATFNPPLLGERVGDVLTAAAYLRGLAPAGMAALGLDGVGPWALLAAALDDAIAAVYADMGAMDVDRDDAYLGEGFAPALRAYGDLRVAPALVAPRPLFLANTARRFPCTWGVAAYGLLGVREVMAESAGAPDAGAVLAWLRAAIGRDR